MKNIITFVLGVLMIYAFFTIGMNIENTNPTFVAFKTSVLGDLFAIILPIVGVTLLVISVVGFVKGKSKN